MTWKEKYQIVDWSIDWLIDMYYPSITLCLICFVCQRPEHQKKSFTHQRWYTRRSRHSSNEWHGDENSRHYTTLLRHFLFENTRMSAETSNNEAHPHKYMWSQKIISSSFASSTFLKMKDSHFLDIFFNSKDCSFEMQAKNKIYIQI